MSKVNSNLPVHRGRLFSWHSGSGSIEASTLIYPHAGRVYDDAADVGFWIESQRTGQKVVFAWNRNRDLTLHGEVYASVYTSCHTISVITVTIFND